METLTYRGRIYGLTVVGDSASDELALECWDLSPSGRLLFTLVRTHGDLLLRPSGLEIPVGLKRSRPLQGPSWARSDPNPSVYSSGGPDRRIWWRWSPSSQGVARRRQWARPTPTTEVRRRPRGCTRRRTWGCAQALPTHRRLQRPPDRCRGWIPACCRRDTPTKPLGPHLVRKKSAKDHREPLHADHDQQQRRSRLPRSEPLFGHSQR